MIIVISKCYKPCNKNKKIKKPFKPIYNTIGLQESDLVFYFKNEKMTHTTFLSPTIHCSPPQAVSSSWMTV